STVTLAAGNYWLGYWYGSNTAAQAYYTTAAGAGRYTPANYSTTLDPPASFGKGTASSLDYSLYATLAGGVSAPASTGLPVVSGSPVQGQVLAATAGSWSGSPTGFGYQWQRCNTSGGGCAAIAGATGSSYTLAAADVGSTLRVAVTASNGGGSTTATSAATAAVRPGTLGTTSVGASKAAGG